MKQLLITVPSVPLAKKRHRTVPVSQCLACQKRVQGAYKQCPDCGGALRFLTNMSYSDSESVKYENLISYCAQQAMKTAGIEMFAGPTRMRMTFLFPVPESRKCKKDEHLLTHWTSKPGTEIEGCDERTLAQHRANCKRLHPGDPHTQRPDVDNCVKSVLDGGNGVLFADDCIIVEMSAKKLWAAEGKAEILVEEAV